MTLISFKRDRARLRLLRPCCARVRPGYSLMLTCRACGVEPHAWLLHVLTELPQRAPDADISDLLPFNYAKRQAEVNVS